MLTTDKLERAKPAAKAYKISAGGGLFVLVTPSGSKLWRWKYRFQGRENLLALGRYPDVGVKAAGLARDDARLKLTRLGVDPNAERRLGGRLTDTGDSFEAIAREWHGKRTSWTPGHAATTMGRLERGVFPFIGTRSVAQITAPEVLALLRRIEGRGHIETAYRTFWIVREVLTYAIATGRATTNVVAGLSSALSDRVVRNLPAVTAPAEVGALLRAIDDYPGTFIVRQAFKLAPLVFLRPGELRAAEWAEIDLDAAEWRIPSARMKRRVPHLVPLSKQAIAILRETRALTGNGVYVFPSARGAVRPMSNAAITAALRRMGYDRDTMTWHGFRSLASTLLNEQGWNRDAIERQLAHGAADDVRAAYNRAEYLPERRKMMQSWADTLDQLRTRTGARSQPSISTPQPSRRLSKPAPTTHDRERP